MPPTGLRELGLSCTAAAGSEPSSCLSTCSVSRTVSPRVATSASVAAAVAGAGSPLGNSKRGGGPAGRPAASKRKTCSMPTCAVPARDETARTHLRAMPPAAHRKKHADLRRRWSGTPFVVVRADRLHGEAAPAASWRNRKEGQAVRALVWGDLPGSGGGQHQCFAASGDSAVPSIAWQSAQPKAHRPRGFGVPCRPRLNPCPSRSGLPMSCPRPAKRRSRAPGEF